MAAKTVLLVDDEEIVISVGRKMLEKLQYSVLTAENGKEALDVYRNNQNEIDFVILDMILPDMGAAEIFDELQSANPTLKVLLSSGYGADQQTGDLLSHGFCGFIQKPFNMAGLSEKIHEVLNGA